MQSTNYSEEESSSIIPSNDAQTAIGIPGIVAATRSSWRNALKCSLPIYIATHVAFLLLTYLATLFVLNPKNFSQYSLPLAALVQFWGRWDTHDFVVIATRGYDVSYRTAFFPLYPLLVRGMAFLTRDTVVAGLIIANLAGLAMFMALYRLVVEDFDADRAYRSVLYLAVFPTAFFFSAPYNESLFLGLALFSFYYMRRGHWWLAGLFGFLTSLTRSAGLFLLIPFLYEYLRQHNFKLRETRLDMLSGLCIPGGIGLFALYCYIRFHDALAFMHAQSYWLRQLHGPWHGLVDAFLIITQHGLLSFDSIHNVIDLSAGLLLLLLLVLCFVGPWRFPRNLWSYVFYVVPIYLFTLLVPEAGGFPLTSLSRLVLELFPAFIVLAAIGKQRQFNLYYLTICGALLAFMLLQFLTGYWIV